MALQQPASERWLYGPIPDLLLGCGLGYAGFFLLETLAGAGMRAAIPLGLAPVISLVSGTPHYGATLLRVYERREDRRAYAIFAVWMSLALAGLFVAGLEVALLGSLLITIYITWSPWHYSGQNYGIALMFLRRRGVDLSPGAKRVVYASFLLSYLLTVLAVHGAFAQGSYTPSPYGSSGYRFLALGIPAAARELGMLIVGGAYAVSVVLSGALLLRRASPRDLAPVAMIFATQALWFSVPTLVRYAGVLQGVEPLSAMHAAYAFVWIAAGHSVQYLWITSYYARRAGAAPRQGPYLLKTLLAGAAIWTVPALIFAPAVLGRVPFEVGLDLLIAAVVNIHHFILDGAIWKLRDGRIARVLIRGDAAERPEPIDVGRRGRLASWLRPSPWVWAAGAVSVAVVAIGTLENVYGVNGAVARGDVARVERAAERLAWMGRDSPRARARLGLLRARAGDFAGGLAEAESGIALHETADGFSVRGDIYALAGRADEAAESYRRALALSPGFAGAANNLAWLLATHPDARVRRPQEAVELAEGAARAAGPYSAHALDTLAAAYAAAGRFDEARRAAARAEELARDAGEEALAREIGSHLRLYASGRAYLQPRTR